MHARVTHARFVWQHQMHYARLYAIPGYPGPNAIIMLETIPARRRRQSSHALTATAATAATHPADICRIFRWKRAGSIARNAAAREISGQPRCSRCCAFLGPRQMRQIAFYMLRMRIYESNGVYGFDGIIMRAMRIMRTRRSDVWGVGGFSASIRFGYYSNNSVVRQLKLRGDLLICNLVFSAKR